MPFDLGPQREGDTPFDASGLRDHSITNRDQLNAAELANVLRATEKYFAGRLTRRKAPFTHAWMLQLHREMFGRVWRWAGQVRTENLNVGIPFYQINDQLQQLVGDLDDWQQHWPDVVEQAVHLHVEAVRIHPFMNGNGRWSRMLANIWLVLQKQQPTAWPPDIGHRESSIRSDYLSAIKRAVNEREFDPLLDLVRRLTPSTNMGG